jgi:hypothetical protein
MKVLIGVDPHKATNAAVAIDEHGEVVGQAAFPANRSGITGRWSAGLSASGDAAGRSRAQAASGDPWPRSWPPRARRWWTCRPSSRRR